MSDVRTADPAIDRATTWLLGVQAPTGEVPSWATPLGPDAPQWEPDSLQFITALVALALADVPGPSAAEVVDRAVAFLRREREDHALWRYWSADHEQRDLTPPDADDTACCSMAVALRGDSTAENVPLLLANRDRRGRFRTWFLPRRTRPRLRRALRDERRPAIRAVRQELWESTEAEPGDVDLVVNANVCRYLGPERAPAAAVGWIADEVRAGREATADKWHRNRFTAYSSIAAAGATGIAPLAALGPLLVERIADHEGGDGLVGPALDTALALLALQHVEGPADLRRRLAAGLRDLQGPDGSWARDVFYHGGPDEVFGWGSEALTTAYAVGVLAREAGR